MYKLHKNIMGVEDLVIRTTDNACIPLDPANTDYQEYLKWLDGYEKISNDETHEEEWVKTSDGNTPLPADTGGN